MKWLTREKEQCREISLFYDFCIIPHQSVRTTKKGNYYVPSKIHDFKKRVTYETMEQFKNQTILKGPLLFKADYAFPILESMPKKIKNIILSGGIYLKITKPDVTDNTQKAFIDAVSKCIMAGDQEISVCIVRKFYAKEPYIKATFTELENPIS